MNMKLNATGIQHLGVPTQDIEKTIEFYLSLGFDMMWRAAPDSGYNVAFLKLHNLVVETYASDEVSYKSGAIDHVAINVQDIEAAFDFCKAANYEMVDAEINFLPFLADGVRYFTILGPNKERVEFNQAL
jgi:hypothetical protein